MSKSDREYSLNTENYQLTFHKPEFDLAFILVGNRVEIDIDQCERYFQSVHKFSTGRIRLEDGSKMPLCLSELRNRSVLYAVVYRGESDLFDLNVLHRDEVLSKVSFAKIDALITEDFANLMRMIRTLKRIPSKLPPRWQKLDESLMIDDRLRYYLCLLFDNRMLSMTELKCVRDFLLHHRSLLNKYKGFESGIAEQVSSIQPSKFIFKAGPNRTGSVVQMNSDIVESNNCAMPQPTIIYSTYEPKKANFVPSDGSEIHKVSHPHISIFDCSTVKNSDRTYSDLRNKYVKSSKIVTDSKSLKSKDSSQKSKDPSQKSKDPYQKSKDPSQKSKDPYQKSSDKHNERKRKCPSPVNKYPINKAKTIQVKFDKVNQHIKAVESKCCQLSKIQFSVLQVKISNSYSIKKDDSYIVNYKKSWYYQNIMKLSNENHLSKFCSYSIINTSNSTNEFNLDSSETQYSESLTQPVNYVIDLTEENEDIGKMTTKSRKRKIIEDHSKFSKHFQVDIPNVASVRQMDNKSIDPSNIKTSPDGLLSLFVLVLNLAPLDLPNENEIYKILSKSCVMIQEGILEPALKNVKVHYENCKTNGVFEIISNIFTIYNESEKEVKNTSFMTFIWNRYFPDNLSNFNLLILFYRFVKLLMLYTIFNKSQVTKKMVLNVIEKIDDIVNFDFNIPISFKKKQLSCFSKRFHVYFKEHDQLHVFYSKLSHSDSSFPTDKHKKLDSTIKKKKIEFTIGPLLKYFVKNINSIDRDMEPIQIEIIYGAVRTLRFCLRKINSRLVETSFSKPHYFNFQSHNTETHFNEVLKEIQFLMKDVKCYQCLLFTDKHYEFINSLLDFSWMVEGTMNSNQRFTTSNGHANSLIFVDSSQYIESFVNFESPITFQYHPESELEYLKNDLKLQWTAIFFDAFKGSLPEPNGARISKEMNILLPQSWGQITFSEAIEDSAKKYYDYFQELSEVDPIGWYLTFIKTKNNAFKWFEQYNLPIASLSGLRDYQYILDGKYKYAS